MKKYIEGYLKGLSIGLGLLTILGITGIAYGAYVSMTDVNNGETLTASTFNIMQENIRTLKTTVDGLSSSSVPIGFIGAFNLSTCPNGWIQANGLNGTPDLRGQFLRGINTFDGGSTTRTDGKEDSAGVRSVGSYQDDTFQGHKYQIANILGSTSNGWNITGGGGQFYTGPLTYTSGNPITDGVNGTPRTAVETRSKNIGVIFCIKQ